MNPLDILLAGVIGYGLYLGASKGVVKGLTNIVTLAASIILAWRFRPSVEAFMVEYETLRFGLTGQGLAFASFVATFIIAFLLVSSIMGYAKKVFEVLPMSMNLDKALGAIIGGFVVTFVLSILLLVGGSVGLPDANSTRTSLLYPYVRDFGRQTLGLLPQAMNSAQEQLKKYTPPPNTDANGAPVQPNKPAPIR